MTINHAIIPDIKAIITNAQNKAIRAVDNERTLMYWHIGKRIFEEEQQGKERAGYGEYLIKYLSEQLQPEYGSGFSYRQLNWYRQFYRTFPIVSTLWTQLSWSQYKLLLGIDNQHGREFYTAEAVKNNWTVRQLERQINSSLYERLLLSNDKESVLAVAKNERVHLKLSLTAKRLFLLIVPLCAIAHSFAVPLSLAYFVLLSYSIFVPIVSSSFGPLSCVPILLPLNR